MPLIRLSKDISRGQLIEMVQSLRVHLASYRAVLRGELELETLDEVAVARVDAETQFEIDEGDSEYRQIAMTECLHACKTWIDRCLQGDQVRVEHPGDTDSLFELQQALKQLIGS